MQLDTKSILQKEFFSGLQDENAAIPWDSIFALRVVFFCEKKFGVKFIPADINTEHFQNFSTLIDFINRKRAEIK